MAAALVGIHSLNQSVAVYEFDVSAQQARERAIADMLVTFKTQFQEWKDTPLRGKDAARLEKHWSAFAKQEDAVEVQAKALLATLPPGDSLTLVEQFSAAHVKMGVDYRKGFDAFKDAGCDPAAGDDAVAGMDREPARLLAEAGSRIAAESASVSARAAAQAHRASLVSIVLMLVAGAAGTVIGVWLSRRITRPVDYAVGVAGRDEIAQLVKALGAMQGSLRQRRRQRPFEFRKRGHGLVADLARCPRLERARRGTGVGAAAGRVVDGTARRHRARERRERVVGQPARARRQHRGAQGRRSGGRGRRDDAGHQRQLQARRRHHRRDRRHRVPDQHPGAQRRGRGGACRRAGSRLRGRRQRGALARAAQRGRPRRSSR